MRIFIATGVYPPDIGGPAQYSKSIEEEFEKTGHGVTIGHYTIEKNLPVGIRHFVFFLKACKAFLFCECAIAMDTFSVGFPTVVASKIFGKKVVLRVAGDFLWESYVERTGHLITIRDFYARMPELSVKEKIILWVTRRIVSWCDRLVFSTEWQRDIWVSAYNIKKNNTAIIENYFRKFEGEVPTVKNFVWAVRPLKLKNGRLLYRAFAEARKKYPDLVLDDGRYPYEEILKRVQSCYAVILPSISDVSPNLILDAVAYGKPFIMTKENGYFEKFKSIGLFVDPFSEKDIAEKIEILADDTKYQEYAQKVQNYSYSHSYTEIASEYLKLFNKL